jgi:oxygen-independent coproporphyrinogen-3 oxidase
MKLGDHSAAASKQGVDHRLYEQVQLMNIRTHALAEMAVPRYTSYPTAPHFTQAVTADDYTDWLSMLPATATLSLYIHVPFCAQLCHYCGCNTKVARRQEPVEAYARRLLKEIRLVGSHSGSRIVKHVHWGGGTPSILGPDPMRRLMDTLAGVFDLDAIGSHAIELDPRHVTPAFARHLAGIGVNRVSLGVQDLAPHVQQAIGRIQPFPVVERAAWALREVGIQHINFDLMYGLQLQTLDDVRRSAEQAVTLAPDRIAYFGYAHVPWFKVHQRLIDEKALPAAYDRLQQAAAARETLTACGYEAIGLDHFARPDDDLAVAARLGRLHRNFQGYTTDDADALIGMGASAIGRLPQGYVQNAPDAGGYQRAVDGGQLATVRGVALSPDDMARGRIIERLMCDFAVELGATGSIGAIQAGHAVAPDNEAMMRLESEGLVRREAQRIVVTETGRPFVRLIAAAFDAYLPKARARHSVAV